MQARRLTAVVSTRQASKASGYGRHLREGEMPDDDQAELVVSIGCAVCIFLIGRMPE